MLTEWGGGLTLEWPITGVGVADRGLDSYGGGVADRVTELVNSA